AAEPGRHADAFLGRYGEGADLRAPHRHGRLLRGYARARQRRKRRPADHAGGGGGPLPRHRRRRLLFRSVLVPGHLTASRIVAETDPIISVRGLRTQFGAQGIDDGPALDGRAGEVIGVVGGSGTGKSVLLRTIVGLNRQTAGTISVFGADTGRLDEGEWRRLEARWGVLFQAGALFSSLTVAEN